MWANLLVEVLTFTALGAGVYVLTRALRFRHRDSTFADARRAGAQASALVLLGWVLLTVYFVSVSQFVSLLEPHPSVRVFTVRDIGTKLFRGAFLFGPALVYMILRRESWASAGVSTHNLGRSLLVGGVLACLVVASVLSRFGDEPQGVLTHLTQSHLWALVYYSVTAVVEEFAFRGFLQTRVVAWLGKGIGLILVAGLMSLAHVPTRIYVSGMEVGAAVISSLVLIPINLLLGYVMLQTENVAAPSLLHLAINWVVTLT